MIRQTLCSALCTTLIALVVAEDVHAQAPSTSSPSADVREASSAGDQLPSVIIDLHKAKDNFDKQMAINVEPELDRLGQILDKNVARAEDLLTKLQNEPANERLHAQYQDCVSEGLSQAMTYLGKFSQLSTPTFAALDGVEKSIGGAQKAFDADMTQSAKEAQANQQRADGLRRRLQELAKKYEDHIKQGKSLPPDVELEIRMADGDRQTAEAMAKVEQLQQTQAKEALADLQAQVDDLHRLRGDLKIAFQQADNHQALLVKVAHLKHIGLQAQAVRKRLDAVQQVVAQRNMDLRKLNNLVQRIVDKDFAGGNPKAKKPIASAQTQPGIDILRAYLPETTANKGTSNVAKK